MVTNRKGNISVTFTVKVKVTKELNVSDGM